MGPLSHCWWNCEPMQAWRAPGKMETVHALGDNICARVYLRQNAPPLQKKRCTCVKPACFKSLHSQRVVLICEESPSPPKLGRKEGSETKEGRKPSKGDFRPSPHSLSWPRSRALGFCSLMAASHWLRFPLEDINAQALLSLRGCRQSGSRNPR